MAPKPRRKIKESARTEPLKPGPVELSGAGLDAVVLTHLAEHADATIRVSEKTLERVRRGRKVVEDLVAQGKVAYGINTGFGRFADRAIERTKLEQLQENLLRSHAVGVGPAFRVQEARAMFLLRVQSLLHGCSGVREELIQWLVKFFNAGLVPVVPEQGSCGASGDLAPLAHLMLPILGEGEVWIFKPAAAVPTIPTIQGPLPAREALRQADLAPLRLAAKEGLALINGTQGMTALGAMACARLQVLFESADVIGALSLEALLGSKAPFHARIQEVRPHPGQKQVAAHLRQLLARSAVMESHRDCGRVQDAYSLRCMPQVHGAARDALAFVRTVVEREMNSATDNPLIFPDNPAGERVLSGGNFHGQPVAQALDFAAMGATDVASMSERRIERLLNPDLSEMPAFFAHEGGLHSGFMMLQVTAASLVSEAKTSCFPASVDSIPTSANKEDHVSMGLTSARKLRTVIHNLEHVLAIELLCAAQGLDYRRPLKSSAPLEAVHTALRTRVKPLREDRLLQKDLELTRRFIVDELLLQAASLRTRPTDAD